LSNQLKESIILNKVPDRNMISFIIHTDLELLLNDNYTISVNNRDKEVFMIEKPYMIDSNSMISNDVSYSLEEIDNGYILLDKTIEITANTIKKEDITVFLLEFKGKIAIRKRNSTGLLANLYEFPNVPQKLTKQEILIQGILEGVNILYGE